MQFDGDAFISYAHLDNVELVEGRKGWVANFHRALEVRVAQLLGHSPEIWRDLKLSGNDLFAETIVARVRGVAILVAVVSPRYLKSEWTLREFSEFWSAAEQHGGIRVHDKARVFKVLKTPVPLDRTPPELRGLLGYEFFSQDPETGKIRELDEVFGPDAQREFWIRLDDLAHDVCALLELIAAADEVEVGQSAPGVTAEQVARPLASAPAPASATGGSRVAASPGTVYLAETTNDVREQREALRRDLLQHGYQVLPDSTLPHVADEAEVAIREQLARSRMSIHLIGKHYGVVPEGGELSLIEMQHELATVRGQDTDFSRLIWIPDGLQVQDERQRRVLDGMRSDPRIGNGADLLETYFEDLRTTMQDWLKRGTTAPAAPELAPGATELPRVYLIADERDVAALDPWADSLFDEGFEVIRPVYDGDEGEIREYHEENLASCDTAVVFYGSGNELWLRRKLSELQKAAVYGRTKAPPTVGICLIGPLTAEKERFRTHKAIVIPHSGGADMELLRPLVAAIKARGVG